MLTSRNRMSWCCCYLVSAWCIGASFVGRKLASLGPSFGSLEVQVPSLETVSGVLGNQLIIRHSGDAMLLGKLLSSVPYQNVRRDSTKGESLTAGIQDNLGETDGVLDAWVVGQLEFMLI
jgi:hypothetical protein